jgi:DNA-binding transcriptional LysR family regulator
MHSMNIAGVDLNLLVVFEALYEERSVSVAASRVGLSQPAMSHALGRLRELLGDRLFVPSNRKMLPTPCAIEMSSGVTSGLRKLRAALGEGSDFSPATSRRVFHVGMTDFAQLFFLPPLLQSLHTIAPQVVIGTQSHNRAFVIPEEELRTGKLDLAVGFFPEAGLVGERVHSELVGYESNVCIARRGNPLVRGRLTIDKFAKAKHVAVFSEYDAPGLIDKALEPTGHTRNLACTVPSFLAVPELVATSNLFAVLPRSLAERSARTLPLELRELPIALPEFPIRVAWHERSRHDSGHKWFRELLRDLSRQSTGIRSDSLN